ASDGAMEGPSPLINTGKQGKHIEAHNNYIPGRSILTADPEELGRAAGSGQQVGPVEVGLPGSKERVVFDDVIGSYVDEAGAAADTTVGIVHYGAEGVHIVPARPQ
ncbi:MAG: polymorphic toxin type 50 domain-containing protein, partial [Myxococcota bacterium]